MGWVLTGCQIEHFHFPAIEINLGEIEPQVSTFKPALSDYNATSGGFQTRDQICVDQGPMQDGFRASSRCNFSCQLLDNVAVAFPEASSDRAGKVGPLRRLFCAQKLLHLRWF